MIATSGFLTALEFAKFVFGRGSDPDPGGGTYSASPDPLAGLKGTYFQRVGEGKGARKRRRGREGKERGGEGDGPFYRKFLDPPLGPLRCGDSADCPSKRIMRINQYLMKS